QPRRRCSATQYGASVPASRAVEPGDEREGSRRMNAPMTIDHATLAATMPLDRLDVSNPALFQDDVWEPYFRRLRLEDPVHYCAESRFGPYWSVTKYKDIMAVEVNHKVFSSESAL